MYEISIDLDKDEEEIVELKTITRPTRNTACWEYFNSLQLNIFNSESQEHREVTRNYCVYPGCNVSYSSTVTTSCLRNHLKNEHDIDADTRVSGKSKKEKATAAEQNQLKELITLFIISSGIFTKKTMYSNAFLLITDFLQGFAFDVVANPEFVNLLKFCFNKNADFDMPGRRSFSSHVKQLANDKCLNIMAQLEKVSKIALTTDVWTSINQKCGYIGITAHFMENFKL